jgi:hypothetical protein
MEPIGRLKVAAFGHCPAAIAQPEFQVVGTRFSHLGIMAAQGGKFPVKSGGDTNSWDSRK